MATRRNRKHVDCNIWYQKCAAMTTTTQLSEKTTSRSTSTRNSPTTTAGRRTATDDNTPSDGRDRADCGSAPRVRQCASPAARSRSTTAFTRAWSLTRARHAAGRSRRRVAWRPTRARTRASVRTRARRAARRTAPRASWRSTSGRTAASGRTCARRAASRSSARATCASTRRRTCACARTRARRATRRSSATATWRATARSTRASGRTSVRRAAGRSFAATISPDTYGRCTVPASERGCVIAGTSAGTGGTSAGMLRRDFTKIYILRKKCILRLSWYNITHLSLWRHSI